MKESENEETTVSDLEAIRNFYEINSMTTYIRGCGKRV